MAVSLNLGILVVSTIAELLPAGLSGVFNVSLIDVSPLNGSTWPRVRSFYLCAYGVSILSSGRHDSSLLILREKVFYNPPSSLPTVTSDVTKASSHLEIIFAVPFYKSNGLFCSKASTMEEESLEPIIDLSLLLGVLYSRCDASFFDNDDGSSVAISSERALGPLFISSLLSGLRLLICKSYLIVE